MASGRRCSPPARSSRVLINPVCSPSRRGVPPRHPFGPQGIRRATNLFGAYSCEMGVDLREPLNMVDIGDVCAIPANIEMSFDQISKAI